MLYKTNVDMLGVKYEMEKVLKIVEFQFQRLFNRESIITSAMDGTHKKGSLHYEGLAVDFRLPSHSDMGFTRHMDWLIHDKLQLTLTPEGYDVILEKNHIHIEYDPKEGK